MQTADAIQFDLVLLGGGHAQVAVLKSFAMRPISGLRLSLVTDVLSTPYSGMLPAFVEGVWRHEDMHIDLVRLAEFAGARLIQARCIGIAPDKRQLLFADRPPLGYDILSINSGGAPALSELQGAWEHSIPVKPISGFIEQLRQADLPQQAVALIGGGAAAVELGLALRGFYKKQNCQPDIHIISKSDRLMPKFPPRAHKLSLAALQAANINVHLGQEAQKIEAGTITLKESKEIACDLVFLLTAAKAPDWLKHAGLALDDQGYIAVGKTLQTPNFGEIFATGDAATIAGHKREKAGVFAVRAGPPLAYNLRAYITGKLLKPYTPQKRYLALVGLADGTALAVRGSLVLRGRFFWHLKKWIDVRFIKKFNQLPEMLAKPPPALKLPHRDADTSDPALQAMRCLGCGAKTSADTLSAALRQACAAALALGADSEFLPDIDALSDSAPLHIAASGEDTELLQSVDTLSQLVSDPFLFGRIAALHALSDIVVAGGKPLTALALIQLRFARQDIAQNMLVNILTGALLEFSRAGVKLVGGHTAEASETVAGFSVLGIRQKQQGKSLKGPHSLILTKPLGVGVLLAAQMRGLAGGPAYESATSTMLTSNQLAAEILGARDCTQMTDVTGFGLARHTLSLLGEANYAGAEIWLDSLPALPEAEAWLARGIQSSLHALNAKNLPITLSETNKTRDDSKLQLIYDPQTSGGILALVAKADAASCISELQAAGYPQAAIIGEASNGQTSDSGGLKIS